MADLYLRFKLRVEVGDHETQACILVFAVTNRNPVSTSFYYAMRA